jgi:hypothetical protein
VIGFAPDGLTVVKYLKSAFQTFMSRLFVIGLDACPLIVNRLSVDPFGRLDDTSVP